MDYSIERYEALNARYSTLKERFDKWRPKLSGICGLVTRTIRRKTYKRIDAVLTKTSQEMKKVEQEVHEMYKTVEMKEVFDYMSQRLELLVSGTETSNN